MGNFAFPASAPLAALNAEHQAYSAYKTAWEQYRCFHAGGEEFRARANRYLIQRQKEPNEVYAERLKRVFYENYIGSIIDWYAATLFRTEPQIETGDLDETFWAAFLADVDRGGCSLPEFLRRAFVEAQITQQAWILIDLPRVQVAAATRAEEDALGKSRAYLVLYRADEVLGWREDATGALEWAKVKTCEVYRASALDKDQRLREIWTIYDRTQFARYQRDSEYTGNVGKIASSGSEETVTLVEAAPHALAGANQVPLVRLSFDRGAWLSDRAGQLPAQHFNKSNALAWALDMGLYAMPVIYSEREWKQIVGEAYYIQLGPEDKFGWTEPEGKVFGIAAENLDRLKDELYRVCYLMMQAGGREAKNLGQSGVSKAWDYRAVEEVLKGFGAWIKDGAQRILAAVALARAEEPGEVSVRGLDNFDIRDLTQEIDDAVELRSLVRQSPTFTRELLKRIALKKLDDASDELKQQIADELDQADFSAPELPEPESESERQGA